MMVFSARSLPCVLMLVATLQGCNNVAPPQPVQAPAVEVMIDRVSGADLGRASLNLSIRVFNQEVTDVTSERARLLSAELRYLPYLFKQTLVESGYWGGVRVAPRRDPTAEINCGGMLRQASALVLELHITCEDALGRTWLDERLIERVDGKVYQLDPADQDPYRPLMIRAANLLSQRLKTTTSGALRQIELAAILRYAVSLAPDRFEQFLQTDAFGHLQLLGLPAESDPMYARVLRIRDSEYQFIDAIDEQFGTIFDEMKVPYALWRRYQFEFDDYNQSLSAKEPRQQRRIASDYNALLGTYRRYQDFKRNEDELEEMAGALQRALAPTVGRVEGQVLELTGSLDQQYELWRSYLMQIYSAEAGTSQPPDTN